MAMGKVMSNISKNGKILLELKSQSHQKKLKTNDVF